MKRSGTKQGLVLGTFLLLVFGACSPASLPRDSATDGWPIEDVVKVVKSALADTEAILVESGLPSLESVALTVQTKFVKTDEFGLKLLVVGGKQGLEVSEASQLTLKLSPPPPTGQAPIASANLYESLKRAIVGAAEASKAARAAGMPELDLNSVSIDLEFSAKSTTTGGIELEVITAKLSGGRTESKTGVHKINISFK